MKVKVKGLHTPPYTPPPMPEIAEPKEELQLTPKGCALVAMLQSGLISSVEDTRVEKFWEIFERLINRLIEES